MTRYLQPYPVTSACIFRSYISPKNKFLTAQRCRLQMMCFDSLKLSSIQAVTPYFMVVNWSLVVWKLSWSDRWQYRPSSCNSKDVPHAEPTIPQRMRKLRRSACSASALEARVEAVSLMASCLPMYQFCCRFTSTKTSLCSSDRRAGRSQDISRGSLISCTVYHSSARCQSAVQLRMKILTGSFATSFVQLSSKKRKLNR